MLLARLLNMTPAAVLLKERRAVFRRWLMASNAKEDDHQQWQLCTRGPEHCLSPRRKESVHIYFASGSDINATIDDSRYVEAKREPGTIARGILFAVK
jgi:hypothetical protein